METYDITIPEHLQYHDFETPVSLGVHSISKQPGLLDMMNSERDSGVATGSHYARPPSMLGAPNQSRSIVEEMQDRNSGSGREATQFVNRMTFAGADDPITVINPESRYDLAVPKPYEGGVHRTMHLSAPLEAEQGGGWKMPEPKINPFSFSSHARNRVTKNRRAGDPDPGFSDVAATSHNFGVTKGTRVSKANVGKGGMYMQNPASEIAFNEHAGKDITTRGLGKPTKNLTGPYLARGSDVLAGSIEQTNDWIKPLPIKNTKHLSINQNWIMQAPREVVNDSHDDLTRPKSAHTRDNSVVLQTDWLVTQDLNNFIKNKI